MMVKMTETVEPGPGCLYTGPQNTNFVSFDTCGIPWLKPSLSTG